MPVNKKYPLEKLIDCIKEYIEETNRQVTFEYVLIQDINSDKFHSEGIIKLLKGINCKLNIIPCNEISGIKFHRPSKNQVEFFVKTLEKAKIHVTLRRARGHDINAACGELRLSKYKDEK